MSWIGSFTHKLLEGKFGIALSHKISSQSSFGITPTGWKSHRLLEPVNGRGSSLEPAPFRIVSGVRAALADDPRSWHQDPLSGWPNPKGVESPLEAKEAVRLSSLEKAFLPHSGETWARPVEGRVFVAELSLRSMTAQSALCPPCQILSVSLQNCSRFYQRPVRLLRTRSGWLRPNERGGQSYARVILPPLWSSTAPVLSKAWRSPATLYSRLDQPLGIGRCPFMA